MRQGNRSGWSSEFFKHPVGCLRSPSFLQVLNIYRRQRYGSHSLPPCAPHLASAMCIRQPLYVSGEGLIRAQLRRLPCHDVH